MATAESNEGCNKGKSHTRDDHTPISVQLCHTDLTYTEVKVRKERISRHCSKIKARQTTLTICMQAGSIHSARKFGNFQISVPSGQKRGDLLH